MTAKTIYKLTYYQKFLGIALIAFGLPLAIFNKSSESTSMLISGLFILFISSDKIMDERMRSLKITSMYFAFLVSYVFKYISSELVQMHVMSYEMVNINHFILMVFAVANLTYYSRLFFGTNRADD